MKGRTISQVVLVLEIALIVLLHVNKSNQAGKAVSTNSSPTFSVASSGSSIGILSGFFK